MEARKDALAGQLAEHEARHAQLLRRGGLHRELQALKARRFFIRHMARTLVEAAPRMDVLWMKWALGRWLAHMAGPP